mgnify:CR=1 FL=1
MKGVIASAVIAAVLWQGVLHIQTILIKCRENWEINDKSYGVFV